MIVKELNAALADEKQREQWLKRVLPGLVITVIYFVFISSTLSDKANNAEKSYKAMISKGISPLELPGMQQQNSSLQAELSLLKIKEEQVKTSFSAKAGFLSDHNHINMNETIEKIAQLIQHHKLRLVEEHTVGNKKISELPHSIGDLKKWLGDILKGEETVHVHHISFTGTYGNVYEMLKDTALSDIKSMPLFLTMKNSESNEDKDIGMKAWTLDLWL